MLVTNNFQIFNLKITKKQILCYFAVYDYVFTYTCVAH